MKLARTLMVGIGLSFFAATTPAQAENDGRDGPFGITMAFPFDSLSITQDMKNAWYAVESVPKPHSLLYSYTVLATREDGVCAITGYLPHTTDGSKIQTAFVTLRSQLDEKYGEGKRALRGSARSAIQRWSWGLAMFRQDRQRDLKTAYLSMHQDGRKYFITVEFSFKNKDDCLTVKDIANPF